MASLVVPVTFIGSHGKATIRTLVDTGAEMTLIPESVARKIGAAILGEVSVRGAGRAVVKVGRIEGIEIPGAMRCKAGPTLVWIFPLGQIFPGTGIQAILGFDFMQKAKMQIAAFSKTRAIRCNGGR